MAEDMNRVILVGRLTRDAELTYTQSGFALTKMSIAVNKRRKQGDQWVEEASFFDITLWGKRGEALTPWLLKGQQIAVDGQLKQDRWEQEGQKRSRVVVEASNIQLLGGKKDNQNQQPGTSTNPNTNYQAPPAVPEEKFEDDLPF